MPEIKIQCVHCSKRFNGEVAKIRTIKACPRCKASGDWWSDLSKVNDTQLITPAPQHEPPPVSDAAPIPAGGPAQPQHPWTSPMKSSHSRTPSLSEPTYYQSMAEKVAKPLDGIAYGFAAVSFGVIVIAAVALALFSRMGALGLAGGVVLGVFGMLCVYMNYLLIKAVCLSLQFLSVMADKSRELTGEQA